MSQVNAASNFVPTNKIRDVQNMDDLNSSDFLQLMIAELQQQDPLNPMDNHELVQQIGAIRDLSATTKLTSTLDTVLMGQNIATASGLIGKKVNAHTFDPATGKAGEVYRPPSDLAPGKLDALLRGAQPLYGRLGYGART